MRALSPRMQARQNWRLIDNDLSLLARVPAAAPPNVTITTVPIDLNRDLELALDGPLDLVTTSALLDLVSEPWLTRLAEETAARQVPIYAALSYDGRIGFDPADPFDRKIVAAVNAHQRTDKGFGPALGPDAAGAASGAVRARRLRGGSGRGRLAVRARRPRDPDRNHCPDGRQPRATPAALSYPT